MSTDDVVKLENISVCYNGTLVLDEINLTIKRNDFLGIIGPNGGGKTTLLKVMLGLVKPQSGQVSVMGRSPEKSRSKIGYVPQYAYFDRDFPINVEEVVLMGLNGRIGLIRRYSSSNRAKAVATLEAVGMLELKDKQIGQLSGGEMQRVLIARALVSDPALLLLDEPTASVDPAMETEFYEMLNKFKEKMAIVLVSHDISAISVHVGKIACLNCELFYHGSKEITADILEATYKCPVQMIAHGTIPHRVLKEH